MGKTAAGLVLVGGILATVAGGFFASVPVFGSGVENDFANDIFRYLAIAVACGGLGAFFYGAMIFSRLSK